MNKREFEAVIEKPPKTPGAYIVIPFDVREVYETKGRVQVKAAFDGHPYRGSLAPTGGGRHVLGVRKDIQQAIGKNTWRSCQSGDWAGYRAKSCNGPKRLAKAVGRKS